MLLENCVAIPCSLCPDPHNLSLSYTHLQGKTNLSPIWECQQSEDPAILVAISILVHNLCLRALNETKCGVSKVIHCQQAFDPNTKLWKNQLNQALASVSDLEMCVLLYSLSLSLCMKITREIGQRFKFQIALVKVGQD